MTLNEFLEMMQAKMQATLGEGVTITISQVKKNNGICLSGIVITEAGKNVSPTIYLDELYLKHQEGWTIQKVVQEISRIYEASKLEQDVDLDFFATFDGIKEKVVYKLIEYEKNRELLQEIPYVQYLNLAIVFYCNISDNTLGNGTILIYNNHLKVWGKTAEELYREAMENTPRLLPPVIQTLEEMMRELFKQNLLADIQSAVARNLQEAEAVVQPSAKVTDQFLEDVVEQMMQSIKADKDEFPMYVLSNQERLLGAACMLYPEVVADFARQLDRDLYVLPSSIHEIIMIPATEQEEPAKLLEMVSEINHTQVDPKEVLADCIYCFRRKTGEFTLI